MEHQTSRTLDDRRWNAMTLKQLDGIDPFVIAVRTTGIYCRVGCPARTPHRHNVTFMDSVGQAQEAVSGPASVAIPTRATSRPGNQGGSNPDAEWPQGRPEHLESPGHIVDGLARNVAIRDRTEHHVDRRAGDHHDFHDHRDENPYACSWDGLLQRPVTWRTFCGSIMRFETFRHREPRATHACGPLRTESVSIA